MMESLEEQELDPKDIYLKVLNITDSFVRKSRIIRLDLDALRAMNPNAAMLASQVRRLVGILSAIGTEDYENQAMASNCLQYALTLSQIADAITDGSFERIDSLIKELEKLINVPIPN